MLAGIDGVEFALEVRAALLPLLQRGRQRGYAGATGDRLDEPALLCDVDLDLVPQGFAPGSVTSLTGAQQLQRVLDREREGRAGRR